MYTSKYELIGTFLVGFFIVSVILGAIGAGVFVAHENNIKSRKMIEACVKSGGDFHQDQGEMTCDQ